MPDDFDEAAAEPSKVCSGPLCSGRTRPLTEFGPRADARDGRRGHCRDCEAEADRRRYATDPAGRERQLGRQGSWRKANQAAAAATQQQRRISARARVLEYYGSPPLPPSCACCATTDDLTIDHIGGGGNAHRIALFGTPYGSARFYRWLIKHGLPIGYQVLCHPCNASKGDGERCRLAHIPGMKRCTGECGEIRPLADFGRDTRQRDGLQTLCRDCKAEAQRHRRRQEQW